MKRAPVSALSRLTAWLSGSVPSLGWLEPRLMLMTVASASWAAHSMPARIQDSCPLPLSLSTLPMASWAPGATPFSRPSEAAPVPATVDATWVPCPARSVISSPGTNTADAPIWPARSGWVGSTPVSRTATRTPAPVSPLAQTAGAPIWAVVSARSACTCPSNQILAIPPEKRPSPPVAVAAFAAVAVIAVQNSSAWSRSSLRAALAMLLKVRVRVAPAGAAPARRPAVSAYDTISGNWSIRASSYPSAISWVTLNSRLSSVFAAT